MKYIKKLTTGCQVDLAIMEHGLVVDPVCIGHDQDEALFSQRSTFFTVAPSNRALPRVNTHAKTTWRPRGRARFNNAPVAMQIFRTGIVGTWMSDNRQY